MSAALPKKIDFILLGGPSRCGKTTLAKRMASDSSYFGFSEDALLRHMFVTRTQNEGSLLSQQLLKYLERPRFKDRRNNISSRPVDGMESSTICSLLDHALASKCTTLGQLVFETFQKVAEIEAKGTPFFVDIHAEFWGHEILNEHQNAIVLIVLRNPVAAISAALYWQSYPKRIKRWRRHFWYRLILWCASAAIADNLKSKYPHRVYCEWVWQNGDPSNSFISKFTAGILKSDDCWDYDFNRSANLFRAPDGGFVPMLSLVEVRLIESLSARYDLRVKEKKNETKDGWQLKIISMVFNTVVFWLIEKPRRRLILLRFILFPDFLLSSFIQNGRAKVAKLLQVIKK